MAKKNRWIEQARLARVASKQMAPAVKAPIKRVWVNPLQTYAEQWEADRKPGERFTLALYAETADLARTHQGEVGCSTALNARDAAAVAEEEKLSDQEHEVLMDRLGMDKALLQLRAKYISLDGAARLHELSFEESMFEDVESNVRAQFKTLTLKSRLETDELTLVCTWS